ncbi:MAG: YqaE/Pmp3 family membrane protein [Bacteroidota bacterium]|nr:YqaE/Pmp3 family membrane protein [Bacteroidota bacterium]
MKKLKSLVIILSATAFMVSCSVERRHYMAGYNIDWKNGKSDAVAKNSATKVKSKVTSTVSAQGIIENSSSQAADAVVATQNAATIIAQGNQAANNTFTAKRSAAKVNSTAETNTLGFKEKITIVKAAKEMKKSAAGEDISKGLYIVLAILIPFVAVGLATDWGIETLWNVLWCLLCGIPGIIHAFIILKRKGIL